MATSPSNKIIKLIAKAEQCLEKDALSKKQAKRLTELPDDLKLLSPQAEVQKTLDLHGITLEKCFDRGFSNEDRDIFLDTLKLIEDSLDLDKPKRPFTRTITLSLI